jgi:hypothetical protein
MTDETMTLKALLEKSADADLLREMIGFTAQRLMALEIEGLTGAAAGKFRRRNCRPDIASISPASSAVSRRLVDRSTGSPNRITKTSRSILVRRIAAIRTDDGQSGQLTRSRHPSPPGWPVRAGLR